MPGFRRMGRPGLIGLAARTAVVAGTASAVSGGMHRNQQAKAEAAQQQQAFEAQQQQAQIDAAVAAQVAAQQAAAPAPAPAPAAGAPVDIIAELQKLAGLKDAGILTDEEFTAAKAKLLA